MGKVLCATRGGQAIYSTQDADIAMVQARGDDLALLFVVDVCFLKRSRRAVRPDVVAVELGNMGRFLLRMAKERAQSQGVRAQTILQHGGVHEALKTTAVEYQAAVSTRMHPCPFGQFFSSGLLLQGVICGAILQRSSTREDPFQNRGQHQWKLDNR